jgi:hypothetical protein
MVPRRMVGVGVCLVAAGMVLAAGNAHFVGTPALVEDGNVVTASGKVAGLGNVPQITVTVSGDAACINPGSNKPQADNKESFSAEGTFPVQNGKALFELTLTAVFQPDCSPPMTVDWSNLRIVVTADDGTVLTFP